MSALDRLTIKIGENYHNPEDPISVEIWHNRGKGFLGMIRNGRHERVAGSWDYAQSSDEVVRELAKKYDMILSRPK